MLKIPCDYHCYPSWLQRKHQSSCFPNEWEYNFPGWYTAIFLAADTLQYLSRVSVPGLAFRALILHYINKGLKNQGCRGKRMAVRFRSRVTRQTLRLPRTFQSSPFVLFFTFRRRDIRQFCGWKLISASVSGTRRAASIFELNCTVCFKRKIARFFFPSLSKFSFHNSSIPRGFTNVVENYNSIER